MPHHKGLTPLVSITHPVPHHRETMVVGTYVSTRGAHSVALRAGGTLRIMRIDKAYELANALVDAAERVEALQTNINTNTQETTND